MKISETFETYRDLMGNLREAYQSSIANRANEIMRVFTAITTVFMPLTVITGIYGMNFDNMPELHWRYGYYAVIGLMITLGLTMFFIFRKKTGFEMKTKRSSPGTTSSFWYLLFLSTTELTHITFRFHMPAETDANHT